MTYTDFDDFKSDIPWFIEPADRVNVQNGNIILSSDFANTFPILHQLIQAARVLDIIINNDHYKLFSWTNQYDESCGWLCKQEEANVSDIDLLPEHRLLLANIGGIKETYNSPEEVLNNNQNFLFIQSYCEKGLSWLDYYHTVCSEHDMTPIPTENLVSFVGEANGDMTLYDPGTKQVYLFAHDHSFDNVTVVPGQPAYTFYYIDGISNFTEYVEALARQWGDYIR